ncbi:uncharacterized protein LOC132273695 [Cornus florida]|uniref:uncharacterized protein LOC132273695 n=1 Tax=Cornus florida TaxID=4283 RepID=UPI0028999F61|nr:uncharacterized protein LOC132273695 [Cornus florida]XP_059630704.1 uncharacterized protein LOC132273695 [Cornus florida]XP_059630705.1 uncharacterized protein LOC132273695 [Cornus florida]
MQTLTPPIIIVNAGRGQNMNRRQRRLARRQQERLRHREMGEEQQVPRFQEEDGQLQIEHEEVEHTQESQRQAYNQGRDPEYSPQLVYIIAQAVAAGVVAALQSQVHVQQTLEAVPEVQNESHSHCFAYGDFGHTSNQCSGLAQGQQNGGPQVGRDQPQSNQQRSPFSTFRGTCYTCGGYGHTSRQCPISGDIGPS